MIQTKINESKEDKQMLRRKVEPMRLSECRLLELRKCCCYRTIDVNSEINVKTIFFCKNFQSEHFKNDFRINLIQD